MPITKTILAKAIQKYIQEMGSDEIKHVHTIIIKVSSNSLNLLPIIYEY
jgi:hypothetical protein